MDIFAVLSLIGGLALFLFGMRVMGQGLEKVSGSKLERALEKMTNNKIKGVLLGLGVTAVIQSSSATTVMVVGFVNSGIMKLTQAVGIIMGANIGTTVTAWMLSLTGLESDNLFVQLLKPDSFAPILAIIGIALMMMAKSQKKQDVGSILVGFTVLMTGMSAMSAAVKPLADVPEFANILTMFTNPFLGVAVGAILTAIIQSSSASVGILQALTVTGSITFGSALPVIMGQNIGTCITALLSCIGANKNAKRTAMVHLYFNLIGTIIFLILFYSINAIFALPFMTMALEAWHIAVVHTIFNVLTTAILLPCSKLIEKLAVLTIRDKEEHVEIGPRLDERLLNTPSFAVEHCRKATIDMAHIAVDGLLTSIAAMKGYDAALAEKIMAKENETDIYEDKIGSYLVKLSGKDLSETDSSEVSMLLHMIGDFERIGDHAANILEVSKEMADKNISFSEEAKQELKVFADALSEILELSVTAFENEDVEAAKRVEPLEQVIDAIKDTLRARHISRLQKGDCTIELGFIFSDLLTNYERVSDHCSNIAIALIEIQQKKTLDAHTYLNTLKNTFQPEYVEMFNSYAEKYKIGE